jgi:hypothetical protein
MALMLANAPTRVDPYYVPTQVNIVDAWGCTNDLGNGLSTPSQCYANIVSYVAARHAVGWKVIIPTMLSRIATVQAPNVDTTLKNQLNALILANTAGADAVVDFTGTNLGCNGCYSNTTYFQADGLHPTQLSVTSIIAPAMSAAINGVY